MYHTIYNFRTNVFRSTLRMEAESLSEMLEATYTTTSCQNPVIIFTTVKTSKCTYNIFNFDINILPSLSLVLLHHIQNKSEDHIATCNKFVAYDTVQAFVKLYLLKMNLLYLF